MATAHKWAETAGLEEEEALLVASPALAGQPPLDKAMRAVVRLRAAQAGRVVAVVARAAQGATV